MAGTEVDRKIGEAVALLRGEKTQQAVAAEMRARGMKWSQATVWSVEKGDRPLRLAEAEALADVLGVFTSNAFLREPAENTAWRAAQGAAQAYRDLVEASIRYQRTQEDLAIAVQLALETGALSEAQPLAKAGGGWLEMSPEDAVHEGRTRLAAEFAAATDGPQPPAGTPEWPMVGNPGPVTLSRVDDDG